MRQVQTKRQPGRMGFFALMGLLGVFMTSTAWAATSVGTAVGANHIIDPGPPHTSWYVLCSAANIAANEDIYDANIMVLESGGWVEYDTDTILTKIGRLGSSYGFNTRLQDPHDHHFTAPATGAVWIKVRTYFSVDGVPSYYLDSQELWRGCE